MKRYKNILMNFITLSINVPERIVNALKKGKCFCHVESYNYNYVFMRILYENLNTVVNDNKLVIFIENKKTCITITKYKNKALEISLI